MELTAEPLHPATGRLRVALDATPLLTPRSGVGEFCYWAMAALAARGDMDVNAFAVSWRRREGLVGQVPEGVSVTGRPMPARPLHKSWSMWPLPPIEAFVGRVDIVHGTNFVVPPARRAAMVVTVHDLTPLHFPQMCQAATLAFPDLVRKAVARGAWVHTPTQFVADEVVHYLGVPAARVKAVHHGIPSAGLGPYSPPLQGQGESWRGYVPPWVERYVLAMSTIEPRKDFPGLVRAFDRLAPSHPGVALVIAGADGWGAEALDKSIATAGLPERVLRLGRVTDQARGSLLEGASAFAYPSVYEGFGLPPLEAMAAGTPVVATSAGALVETLGDSALFVSQGDTEQLSGALEEVLDRPQVAEDLRRRGYLQASKYSWAACAKGLADLYRLSVEK
ncbi:MAG TPA: glycosyltransferase family 1 protein [Acidimicrobiales bacterium]|nr:glycosyltransferase family 1 protein [Acidimicrobiales bacterium]